MYLMFFCLIDFSSEEMKIKRKLVIWHDCILMCIVGKLLSVHRGSWYLDASTEVHITVAEMVSQLLDINLSDLG